MYSGYNNITVVVIAIANNEIMSFERVNTKNTKANLNVAWI